MKSLKKILILNWKEFGDLKNINHLLQELLNNAIFSQLHCIFCPPVVLLSDTIRLLGEQGTDHVSIGSQSIDLRNGSSRIRGRTLSEISCRYAMCGHVEKPRPNLQEEVLECAQSSIRPIVLLEALGDLTLPTGAIVVYEPRTAVGAAEPTPTKEIGQVIAQARQKYGFPTLYGGAVTAENARDIACVTDGLCVGRASRDLEQLKLIAEAMMECADRHFGK